MLRTFTNNFRQSASGSVLSRAIQIYDYSARRNLGIAVLHRSFTISCGNGNVHLLHEQNRRKNVRFSSSAAGNSNYETPILEVMNMKPLSMSPPDILVQAIDSICSISGLPYWGGIVAVTIGIRLFLFPAAVFQTKATYRMMKLKPALEAVTKQSQRDTSDNRNRRAVYADQIKALCAQYKVKPWHPLVFPILQMPIFVSFYIGINRMGEYCQGFDIGGLSWAMDLSASDPTKILPVLTSISFLAVSELGADGIVPSYGLKATMRLVSLLMLFVSQTMPAGVLIYWTSSNVFAIGQTLFLRIPRVKKVFGLPTRIPATPDVSSDSTNDFIKAVGSPNIFKGISEFIRNRNRAQQLSNSVILGKNPNSNPEPIRLSNGPRPKTFITNPLKSDKNVPETNSEVNSSPFTTSNKAFKRSAKRRKG